MKQLKIFDRRLDGRPVTQGSCYRVFPVPSFSDIWRDFMAAVLAQMVERWNGHEL